MNNYETELAAAIERGRAILAERQRKEDERQHQFEREAEERRQRHLAKLPEWARAFAVAGGNYEDYIKINLPDCTEIYLKSTSYNNDFDTACVYIPDEVKFENDRWFVSNKAHWLTDAGTNDDIFAEAVAIAASNYHALREMQADADARNALPADELPY